MNLIEDIVLDAHIGIYGSTQSGKTYWINEILQKLKKLDKSNKDIGVNSLFFNQKNPAGVQSNNNIKGQKMVNVPEIPQLKYHNTINFKPSEEPDKAKAQLDRIFQNLKEINPRSISQETNKDLYYVIAIDEQHELKEIVQKLYKQALGYNIVVIGATQYPTELNTTIRNNVIYEIFFQTGNEATNYFQRYNYPERKIREWNQREKYRYCITKNGKILSKMRPI